MRDFACMIKNNNDVISAHEWKSIPGNEMLSVRGGFKGMKTNYLYVIPAEAGIQTFLMRLYCRVSA
ncbi:MAG: hypothetical protein SCALA702_25940 [Melioribacteraceae bacterium]|nr:MAG: hypothetical protein SCALA702_25940 [Melioribacteraceae bacterium]